MAEVYRRTGLVQIYNTFPNLLSQQVRKSWRRSSSPLHANEVDSSRTITQDFWLSRTTDCRTTDWQNTSCPPPSAAQQYLTSLALSTIQLLQSIPLESRTRCLQPFLVVASCSQLHLPLPRFAASPSPYMPISQSSQLSGQIVEISRMRSY
jgi:hypothetical protein